jgi:hypothetical protein
MASKHSASRLYQSWLAIPAESPDWTLDDQKDLVEGGNVLTTEPGGVDYLETDAGRPLAMSEVPKGSVEDRVLFRPENPQNRQFRGAFGVGPDARRVRLSPASTTR